MWKWQCSKLPRAWPGLAWTRLVLPWPWALYSSLSLSLFLPWLVVCAALWLIHQQMRQLCCHRGLLHATHTQLQRCNKSVVHAADPLNAAASLSLCPLSSALLAATSFGTFCCIFKYAFPSSRCSSALAHFIYVFSFVSLFPFFCSQSIRRALLSLFALQSLSPRSLLMCKLFMTHSWFLFLSFFSHFFLFSVLFNAAVRPFWF